MTGEDTSPEATKPTKTPAARKRQAKRGGSRKERTRTPRVFPVQSFEEALALAEAIHAHASGERVARLTLLKQLNMSPTARATQALITSSGQYGLTKGSYAAEHLELTSQGKLASDRATPARTKARVQFELAVRGIAPFSVLYEKYRGKKLPSHDVMRDVLKEAELAVSDEKECIDTFIVNAKFLGLLQTIAGSETLVPLETLLEQLPDTAQFPEPAQHNAPTVDPSRVTVDEVPIRSVGQWDRICFYVTPIGEESSEQRKHSDLFLSSLIEPALNGFGLEVVRADKIGQPGMITSQILEHILRARLVIADLSFHNPNVFYEMALRHMTKLPIVQICRKSERLPFDVNQVRTITIDTSDIYTLVPRLETYRSEIASLVRAALGGQASGNPISVFFPGVTVTIPKTSTAG